MFSETTQHEPSREGAEGVMAAIETRELTWLPDVREYVGDASDFDATRRAMPRAIVLKDERGDEVLVDATCSRASSEGELLYVVYGPRASFRGRPFTVRIFND